MTVSQLLTNATVLDHVSRPAAHDTVGIVGDRIVAVGPRAEVAPTLPEGHRVIDLAGRTIVPGFVDSHLHPLVMCFYEHHVDLSPTRCLADVLDGLSDRAAQVGPRDWVVGLQLDDENLDERRLPHRTDLDRVGGGRPVVVVRRDGHHALGSSAALAAAGIDDDRPDPPGGRIHRDAAGTLTGLCGEAAAGLLLAAVPTPGWDELAGALERVVARLARHGVTGISAICQTSEVGPAGRAGELEAVAWSALVDAVPFDVQTILVDPTPATVDELRAGPLHRPADRRRLDAVKLFLDGTLGGRTACLRLPYTDAGGRGMLTLDPEAAYPRMVAAHTAGLQICIHAIGDRANDTAVDLYRRLLAEHPAGDHRHRVEHASVLGEEAAEQMAELGIAAVVQPASIESEQRWLGRRLGPDRLEAVYPYRRMLDAGMVVAGSSDAPIESCDVLGAMRAAVDRCGIGPSQAITAPEALGLWTRAAAHVRHADDAGVLAPGARADLVVLTGDPRHHLADVGVVSTIAGGREIHHAGRAVGRP